MGIALEGTDHAHESVGEVVDWAGPHRLDDYFARGDADALDAICDAIA